MTKSQYITRCALFCALGALLPQAFHVFGAVSGQAFLPMHLPAMCAGLFLGPTAGAVTGLVSPLLSYLITGGTMPVLIKVPFMMLEVATYGAAAAAAFRRLGRVCRPCFVRTLLAVLCAQIAGRAVNVLSTVAAVYAFGVTHKAVTMTAALAGIGAGLPGIAIQLVFLPTFLVTLQKITGTVSFHSGK